MKKFDEFYNTIDDITEYLQKDLIGPIKSNEIIESEKPLNVYSLGILHSHKKNNNSKTISLDSLEKSQELFEESDIDDNSNIFKQSSMGISFSTFPNDNLEICFNYAMYKYSYDEKILNNKNIKIDLYSRNPKHLIFNVKVPNKLSNQIISTHNEDNVLIYMTVRKINSDGSELVTVSVINKNISTNEYLDKNIKAFFQCELFIKNKNGFMPIYKKSIRNSIEDETNDMLYDNIENYSYGHGCSPIQIKNNGTVTEIKSSFLPKYRMCQMTPRIIKNADYLYMKYWNNVNRKKACDKLREFILQYETWFKDLQHNKDIISKYPSASDHAFSDIKICINRLNTGVDVLLQNDIAWKSFIYMNEAMLLQRIKTKNCSADVVSWYPFQLAYILQIIPDIVNDNSIYRNNVDLLWFPTGGGKTEAYLGLSAFTIFYRRLSGDNSKINGVTIIMRYTLRLLTIQQFERATALICSCEYLRNKYKIPGKEISIGLWIGASMTPNHINEAEDALQKLRNNPTENLKERNPIQILKCPWCGAEININGYSINENKIMNISCHNNLNCEFHNHLPIYVVDDDIYNVTPTFILSTVDKFARITWEEKAGNLFGANECDPPSLIIQDELHLISGPLGSITGVYEIAIDNICSYYGKSPKIIASTATIKNAKQQIKVLYNKDMLQFPPNGLSQTDSFFAVMSNKNQKPARTYVGISSSGTGMSEMMIKILALSIFLKHLYIKQNKPIDVIDQYYTYVNIIHM